MLSRLHISKSDRPEIPAWEVRPVASSKNAYTELEYHWRQCLQARESDRAWQLWSRNAEQTLHDAGALNTQGSNRARGTARTLQPAGSRMANGQRLRERQCRRFLRKIEEASASTQQGRPVPHTLARSINRSVLAWGLHSDARQHRWGAMRATMRGMLSSIMEQEQQGPSGLESSCPELP